MAFLNSALRSGVRNYRWQRRKLGAARRFLRKEFRWETDFSSRSPQWWREGFLSRSATLYGLDRGNDPSLYVNDVQRYLRTKNMVNPHLQEAMNNKFNFFLLMNSLSLEAQVVPFLGICSRGRVHGFPDVTHQPTAQFLEKTLSERPHIFAKPLHGAEANGVRSIRRDQNGYRIDGSATTLDEITAWVESFHKPLLFEAAVPQHEVQSALNPEATNTIRVLTMPDLDKDHEPFIARAVHRIGTSRSGHVDNWTKGGLSAAVDLETGQLSQASRLPEDNELEWFSHHPDTGSAIEGITVPFWEETKKLVLDGARKLGFLEYIGWDIIISPTGPVILEANINSGMNVLQVHGPLLADPRVKRYYTARGAVVES
ncbi:sugar-transfer associated ATP-grasp domain-containing protein [Nesterenkonia sp. NBAIMH1]|uniref:sugar-transfer associated ATP-grasp domain-containing protein n=1 Tax=Nesterenkonia sp. NBAIMH1 TaxID=2600320 RepID=UPI00143DDED7|nr:sugar-transfer associated ATP-grasp domain-containing protein [Nesterenkonia sp. NBAIMH1]